MSERSASTPVNRIILLLLFALLYLSVTSANAADSFDINDFIITHDNGENAIHIPAGVYRVSRPIILPSNTILEGEGQETVLEAIPDFKGERFISNSDFAGGNKSITVKALKIRFGVKTLTGSTPGVLRFENAKKLRISDISMELDTALYGIDLSANVVDASIERCAIKNSGGGGGIQVRNRDRIQTHGSADIVISGNEISSAGDEPIAVFGWLGKVSGVSVTDNTVSASDACFGITAYGIDTHGNTGTLSNVRITGNTVQGGRHGAIGVKGGASDILLDGNIISETANDGIFLDAGGEGLPHISNIRVFRNRLTDAGRHGIYAAGAGIEITGNSITGCKGAGIYVCELSGGRIDVENNLIEKAARCMIVDGRMQGTISKNSIKRSGSILYLNK